MVCFAKVFVPERAGTIASADNFCIHEAKVMDN